MSGAGDSLRSRRSVLKGATLGVAGVAAGRALTRSGTAIAFPVSAASPAALRGGAGAGSGAVPSQAAPTAVLRVAQTTLDPEGRRPVTGVTVNGSFPGPEIRVREGDLVRLLLENHLTDQATFLHWHGLLLPFAMDGVPGVSGPPVAPGGMFFYEFPIRQSGTYWYHSHFLLQEQIGAFGAFVIEPRDEPGGYDRDAVVLLSDWLDSNPYDVIPNLRAEGARAGASPAKVAATPPMPGMEAKPGMGTAGDAAGATKPGAQGMPGMAMGGADLSDVKYNAFLLNGRAASAPWTLEAKPGQRIRLRIVNAGASTLFHVSLDGHSLEVTHADGLPVRPVVVDRILMGMGECYDVIVTLGEAGSYTLHAVAQDGSGQAVGVLHSPGAKPAATLDLPKAGGRLLAYADLVALEDTTLPPGTDRDYRLVLGGDMRRYIWTIGGEAYPDASPLLIRPGERVGVEMVNQTAMWHPMHLHGHFFRVLTNDGPRCPLKHTVNVAPGESLRIEFTADNPGRWFFHCHNLYHLEAGMARVWEYTVAGRSPT